MLLIIRKEEKIVKDFYFEVNLKFGQSISADTLEEASEILKSTFEEEYNIELDDSEIVFCGSEPLNCDCSCEGDCCESKQ